MTRDSKNSLVNWRSLLFIPADKKKFIDSAATRGADAIILDLEDSIPQSAKPAARAQLSKHIVTLHNQSLDVVVRINYDLINAVADLDVAVSTFTAAIMVPKVMGANHLRLLDDSITLLEQQRGICTGTIKLIALIESIEGLENAKSIAMATPRLMGLALGTEDLSLDGGFEPTPENLFFPAQKIVYAARLANISVFGFPASIADFSDIKQFTVRQVKAKSMGFNGALCIHPTQVRPINEAHTPTEDEIVLANKIVAAYKQALEEHSGVVQIDGKMIDLPVVERAQRTLASPFHINNKQ